MLWIQELYSEDRIEAALLNWTYAWKDRTAVRTEIQCYGAEKAAAVLGRDGITAEELYPEKEADSASGTAVYRADGGEDRSGQRNGVSYGHAVDGFCENSESRGFCRGSSSGT